MSLFKTMSGALAVSVPAAAIASLPAALRGPGVEPGTLPTWLALTGVTVLPMALAVVVLRGARGGLAELAGEAASPALAPGSPKSAAEIAGSPLDDDDAAMTGANQLSALLSRLDVPDEHRPSRQAVLSAVFTGWGTLLCAGLAPLAAILRARTHHHGLAGVTFAILALLLALALAIVCRRVVEVVTASAARTQRLALGAFWIALGLAVLLLGAVSGARSAVVASAGGAPASASAGALTIDVLAFVLAAAFAARPPAVGWPRRSGAATSSPFAAWLAYGGGALGLVLAVAGAGSLSSSPRLIPQLTASSSLFALARGADLTGDPVSGTPPEGAPGTTTVTASPSAN